MNQISINNGLNGDSWKIMFALRSITNIGHSLFAFIIIDSDCWIKVNMKIRSVFYELEKIMDIYHGNQIITMKIKTKYRKYCSKSFPIISLKTFCSSIQI